MGVSERAGRGPGPWGGRGAEIGMRGRKRGKGWGVRGRIKDREAGGKNKRMTLTDSGFSLCTSGDDDGFNEATVNSLSLSLPPQTQKYTQSGGEIDLKSGGSALTRPLFYLSCPVQL